MLQYTKKSLELWKHFLFWRNLVLTKMGLRSKPESLSTLFSHNPYLTPLYLLRSPFMDMVISHVPPKFPTRRACTSLCFEQICLGCQASNSNNNWWVWLRQRIEALWVASLLRNWCQPFCCLRSGVPENGMLRNVNLRVWIQTQIPVCIPFFFSNLFLLGWLDQFLFNN